MSAPNNYGTAKDLADEIETVGLYTLVSDAARTGEIHELRERFLAVLRGCNGPNGECRDAARLAHVCDKFDGFNDEDFHEVAWKHAKYRGADDCSRADYLAAYREVIDRSIAAEEAEDAALVAIGREAH